MRRKILGETHPLESPDIFSAMTTMLTTSSERVHVALTFTLLAACAANLLLLCAWL
jgi:hypothetical protein